MTPGTRSTVGWLLACATAAAPTLAQAHLATTGLGPFYDGAAHLFASPETLLPVLGLILLAGLGGPAAGRALLWTLPTTWLAARLMQGMLTGWELEPAPLPGWATAALVLVLGGLVAADLPLSRTVLVGLAILVGAVLGTSVGGGGLALTGACFALAALVIVLTGQVAVLGARWARTAVRVAGSWIAASGLLLLGWTLKGA